MSLEELHKIADYFQIKRSDEFLRPYKSVTAYCDRRDYKVDYVTVQFYRDGRCGSCGQGGHLLSSAIRKNYDYEDFKKKVLDYE